MRQDILDIPDHLRDALWRAESARLEPGESNSLLICGVGGSAIGGDLARAVIGDRLRRPMLTVRGYALPSWVGSDDAVLCSSFSGATEEAIACYEDAAARGCRRVVASTGGPLTESARADEVPVIGLPGILSAPRAAVAYMAVTGLEVAARCGVAPRLADEIEAAAAELAGMRDELAAEAANIAAKIGGATPIIYGAELTEPVAKRWKAQINENAKRAAFASAIPEANHNEICAWGIAADGDGVSAAGRQATRAAVFLADAEQHPRIARRLQLTAELIAAAGNTVCQAQTRGSTRLARLMSTVVMGDLVSIDLAERDGIDPLPIPAIDMLKERLA